MFFPLIINCYTIIIHLRVLGCGSFESVCLKMSDISCSDCGRSFSQRKHLYAHLRNIHHKEPIVSIHRARNSIICSYCSSIFSCYGNLRDHIACKHDISFFKEEMHFQNRNDFLLWKNEKEKDLKCSYIKPSGTKVRENFKKEYYLCHRSYQQEKYKHASTASLKKLKKTNGYVKTMYSCPSTIEMVEKDGQYKVVIYLPHLGHRSSLEHINLSAFERTQIAGKIAEGVSFERILDDVRNNVKSEGSLERIHLLDRQDLRNIKRQFNLTPQYHQSDVISVDLMINHMQKLQEDSPILYYKKQGEVKHMFGMSDFFLAIMTSFQVSLAKKFGSKKICVDSTHGTTGYDFLLTTLLTVDEYGEGVPLAFLISNKTDTATLSFFFQLVKEKIGYSLATETFMSDDAPEFYNSWSNTMEIPKNHLLCIWHVDKNWRINISQKVHGDQEVKANVYKHVRCLMECQDQTEFNELLTEVVNNLLIHENTKEFGKYFYEHYVKRPQQWAFCFRHGLGINTNMFLESMHKMLKHIYLEGKKCKRVDKCIQALMTMVRDHMFKRLKKTIKGKVTYRISLIQKSHKNSLSIKKEDVAETSSNTWKIKSSTRENHEYFVQKENSCSDCKLICIYCNVCVHSYTCTCLDNFVKGNICKHIHAVCRFNKNLNCEPSTSKISSENSENIQVELQAFTSQHGKLQTDNENLKIKTKLDILYKYVSENTYDKNISLRLEKLLDSALCIAKQNKMNQVKSREPTNKKVDKQLRFQSTKKKRKVTTNMLAKPTSAEKKEISDDIQYNCLIKEAVRNDHSYI